MQRFLKNQINRLEGCVGRECKYNTGELPRPGLRARAGKPIKG